MPPSYETLLLTEQKASEVPLLQQDSFYYTTDNVFNTVKFFLAANIMKHFEYIYVVDSRRLKTTDVKGYEIVYSALNLTKFYFNLSIRSLNKFRTII